MQGTRAAAALIVLAMADIALIDSWVRHVAPDIGLWQFTFMRCVMACAMLLPLVLALGWRLRPVRAWAVLLRSAAASLGMVLYFGALALMTIAQAGAGLFTAPIFVLIVSALVFGVRVGPVRIAAVALGFVGVLVVLRPWGAGVAPAAAALAVTAGLFHALGAVLTRQLCRAESTATLNMGFFLGMAVWGLLGLVAVAMLAPEDGTGWFSRGWVAPSGTVLAWSAAHALGSVIAIGLLIRGYQLAEASRVTVFEYSFLPLAALWTWLQFGDRPDPATLVGMALIVSAGTVIALRGEEAPRRHPGVAPVPTPPRSTQP